MSCLWDPLLLIERFSPLLLSEWSLVFLLLSLSGPLPYVSCQITVKYNALSALLNKTFPSFKRQFTFRMFQWCISNCELSSFPRRYMHNFQIVLKRMFEPGLALFTDEADLFVFYFRGDQTSAVCGSGQSRTCASWCEY